MFFKRIKGIIDSNCYIIGDMGECVIIDPGTEADMLMDIIGKEKLAVKYIVLTHAHYDHIFSADVIRGRTGAKVAAHKDDAVNLGNPVYNGAILFGSEAAFKDADILAEDGDELVAGGMSFSIIHTPGHSPGCICIRTGNKIFTGDTLFYRSVGRTDLGNGSYSDLMNSIKNKLMILDDEVEVYPGHGEFTTIGSERRANRFIR